MYTPILLLVVAVVGVYSAPADNPFSDKFDNKVDIKAVLKNERLLNNYMNCILDKGSCTSEGSQLKGMYLKD